MQNAADKQALRTENLEDTVREGFARMETSFAAIKRNFEWVNRDFAAISRSFVEFIEGAIRLPDWAAGQLPNQRQSAKLRLLSFNPKSVVVSGYKL